MSRRRWLWSRNLVTSCISERRKDVLESLEKGTRSFFDAARVSGASCRTMLKSTGESVQSWKTTSAKWMALLIIAVHHANLTIMSSIVTKGKKYQWMPYTAKRAFQVQKRNTDCSMVRWSVSRARLTIVQGGLLHQVEHLSAVNGRKVSFSTCDEENSAEKGKKTFPLQLEIAIGLKFAGSIAGPDLWNSRMAEPCHHGGIDWDLHTRWRMSKGGPWRRGQRF